MACDDDPVRPRARLVPFVPRRAPRSGGRASPRVLLRLVLTAFFTVLMNSQAGAGWKDILFKADEVSQQGHSTQSMRQRGQDSAIVLAGDARVQGIQEGCRCRDFAGV